MGRMRLGMVLSSTLLLVSGLAGWACGAETSATTPDPGESRADAATPPSPEAAVGEPRADAASVAEASADAEVDAGPLLAPQLMMAKTTDGGVQLGWVNRQPDCERVIGERKIGLVPYAEAFDVSGTTTETTDSDSTTVPFARSSQCVYRLRCTLGSRSSPYSNELATFCAPGGST
ncbi:MAG: hypothetical protein U0270_02360 [Labilithrix sp.]